MKAFLTLLLLFFVVVSIDADKSFLIKQITTCSCVAFKSPELNINQNLVNKCTDAINLNGTLNSAVYNTFSPAFKSAFQLAAPLVPYNCLNFTFPESSNFGVERTTIYSTYIERQQPLIVFKPRSIDELIIVQTLIDLFNPDSKQFNISVQSGGHDYYGVTNWEDTFVIKLIKMAGVVINSEDDTVIISGGANALTIYKKLAEYEETSSLFSMSNNNNEKTIKKHYNLKGGFLTKDNKYGYNLLDKNNINIFIKHYKEGKLNELTESKYFNISIKINKSKLFSTTIPKPYTTPFTIGLPGMGASQLGFGMQNRDKGMFIHNIIEYLLVNAKGKLIKANAQKNKKTYFALRGSKGGSYGTIVSYKAKVN